MINVLIVAGDMHVGGIENQLMHLVRNADRTRFHFDFTSTMPNAHYRDEIERLGCGFILLPYKSRQHPIRYCRFLLKTMKTGNYCTIHSHELFHSGITLGLAWLAGIPSRIAHAHNIGEGNKSRGKRTSIFRKTYQFVMRWFINCFATQFVACSTPAGRFLYGERILKKQNYHLVFNSVDTSRFLKEYGIQESGDLCREGWANILHVARMDPVKNQLFLTDVANEMKERQRNIRILCVGTGGKGYTEKVEQRIKEKHLADYLLLLGVRKDIEVLMRKARVFVLPSVYEGMPLTLIEAQSSGLPCVVNDSFSHEVDFGLNLITWMNPDTNAHDWGDAIIRATETTRPTKEQVEDAIHKGGFDSRIFAERICSIYEKDLDMKKDKHSARRHHID